MKRLLIILTSLFFLSAPLFAQDDDDQNDANEKIRDKMNEYIQKRLDLSKDEAAKFTPVFLKYFKEWRQTLRETRGLPPLDRQQKIVDLQIRYRAQFREVVGEKRGDQVFEHQRKFIKEMVVLRMERQRNNPNRMPLRRQ
jgi:hypothetical protein